MSRTWASSICSGRLRHRRFQPRLRGFEHRVTYFYLDLAEIPQLFRYPGLFSMRGPSLFSWERKNFFGSRDQDLDESLRRAAHQRLGFRPSGPIHLLCQIGYLGYGFNPVSFYFFFSEDSSRVEAIAAEITNTPWDERHSYFQDCRAQEGAQKHFEFRKEFHVSPFLGMEYLYRWSFSLTAEQIGVHMENHPEADPERVDFDATLTLRRNEWNGKNLTRSLIFQPAMTFKTLALIYLHAAILYVRRFRFYPHPGKVRS